MNIQRQTYPLPLPQLLIWGAGTIQDYSFAHLCCLVKLKDASSIERWIEAIRQVISENEGLRLRMVLQHGDVRQYVAPDQPVEVPIFDFSHAGGAEEYRQWVESEIRRCLPVIDSPLFYFAILRLGSQDYRLMIKVHHLVFDAWSMTVLIEQITKHYHALQAGEVLHELPPTSFVKYILQQNAPRTLEKAKLFLHYFFEILVKSPAAIKIRPGLPAAISVKAGRKTFTIPPNLRHEIVHFCESNRSSIYLFFLTGISLYISLVNDAEDVAIGTTFHNRLDPAYQNTIGMFAAILPLRVKVADELSFRELIKRVLSAWKGSIQRQPGLISLQELTAVYQHSAGLFDVLVSYESRLPNEPPEWLYRESDLPHISLMIAFLDYPAGLEMELLYRTELFTDADIAMMVQQLKEFWVKLLAEPDRKIGEMRGS